MTSKEKVAYLKGLIKGMDLDKDKKENKIFKVILDILEDLTSEVEETQCDIEDIYEALDEFDSDLADVEEEVFDCYDNCNCCNENCDCGCDCDCDDSCECDCHYENCCDENDDFYEVICPKCNEQVCFSENILANEAIKCPNCDELLEFDFDKCSCGCNDEKELCKNTCECGCDEDELKF